jgi:hypothetical protein
MINTRIDRPYRVLLVASIAWLIAPDLAAQQPAAPPAPMVKENATVKLATHTHVIPDMGVGGVPNVGIIVGDRATLVIDTGLGQKNGETVMREVGKVSRNADLYLQPKYPNQAPARIGPSVRAAYAEAR